MYKDWVNDTTGDFTRRRIKGSTDSIGTGYFENKISKILRRYFKI